MFNLCKVNNRQQTQCNAMPCHTSIMLSLIMLVIKRNLFSLLRGVASNSHSKKKKNSQPKPNIKKRNESNLQPTITTLTWMAMIVSKAQLHLNLRCLLDRRRLSPNRTFLLLARSTSYISRIPAIFSRSSNPAAKTVVYTTVEFLFAETKRGAHAFLPA
jgi:hypothetical protein